MQSVNKCNLFVVAAPAKRAVLPRITQNQLRHIVLLHCYAQSHSWEHTKNHEYLRQAEEEVRVLLEAGAEVEPEEFRVQLQPITKIVLTRSR